MEINSNSISHYNFYYSPFISSIYSKSQEILDVFKETIGSIVRDGFFLPLAGKLSIEDQNRLKKEVLFYKDFWNTETSNNPHLPYLKEIQKHFSCKTETTPIELNGKHLQVEYSLIESPKSTSKNTQNLVFILGNLSTINNNIVAIYPFLASYLEKSKTDPSIAPLCVISINQYSCSQNGLMYKPKTLDESGEILTKTLKQIALIKGPITQITGHSLGSIILASSLKTATKEKDLLPLNIYFDRGPSSISDMSKKLGLTGWVLLQIAKFSGWDIDVGLEIQKHLLNRTSQNIFISEVLNDYFFSENSSLCKSPYLQNLKPDQGIQRLSFDFAAQLYDEKAHHNIHNGNLDGHHLTPRQPSLLKNDESMSDKIMSVFTRSQEPKRKSLLKLPLFKKFRLV